MKWGSLVRYKELADSDHMLCFLISSDFSIENTQLVLKENCVIVWWWDGNGVSSITVATTVPAGACGYLLV